MGKAHHHAARKVAARPAATGRAPDAAVYLGLLMIGLFGTWLWYIMTGDWKPAVLGYVIAMAVLINLYTWRVCTGRHLARWQQSLARLPLRWVGYGTRDGKPLEAAHGSQRARMMLYVSIATGAVIVAVLTLVLFPR